MTEENELVVSDVSENTVVISNEVDNSIVPYLFKMDKISKPNCILCQSKFREEVEEMYDNQRKKNYSEIKRFLKENHNFDICINAIRNHIVYHHKAIQDNATLQEYADKVQMWVNMQTNKPASLKARIAILEREMFTIAQKSEELDIIERRKNADTLKKLAEVIMSCEDKLSEFQETVKPVNLIFNQLKIIVNDELQHVDNVKTKRTLTNILTRLKDSVSGLIIQ